MDSEVLDRQTAEVARRLPVGPRLAVIGSTLFWHPQSEETCILLGRSLAGLDGLVLLTGGVKGVGEAVGRSFWAACRERESAPHVFHILPRGCWMLDYGETLFAGSDMGERREILGRLAEVYVAIEGGPGTAQEASAALARSVVVIPVGRSGGHSAVLYERIPRPSFTGDLTWRILGIADVSPTQVAGAVIDVVRAYLKQLKDGI